jgi:nucleotide-binding universal stress UspA family protein
MKVLFPTDFSEMSARAWKLAVTFAVSHKAELVLLHVIEPPAKALQMVTEFDKELAYRKGRKQADQFLAQHPVSGLRVARMIKVGPVSKMIAEAGEEIDPVAIVMGTQGASGFRESFVGSNARRVLKLATRPVAATRNEMMEDHLSNFLLPIDLSQPVNEKIKFGLSLARQFFTRLTLLYVCPSESEKANCEDKMAKLLEDVKKVKTDTLGEIVVSDKAPGQAILEYAKDNNMGMICIMTQRERRLKDIIMGSTATYLLNESPIPVIAIRPKTIYQARATGSMLS